MSFILMLRTTSSIDSLASATQIVVEFDSVDAGSDDGGKLIEKLSKS